METRAKKKSTTLYTTQTMHEGSSLREDSETSRIEEVPEETTPQAEDPQGDVDNDKSSTQLSDFVSAIKALGKSAASTAKPGRVKEPDPFNGREPKKLKTFILQCRIYFRGSSESFQDDARRVTFAISYLRDVALEWFEPGLSGLTEEPPEWLEDWDAFVDELQTNFGPYDESGDVENELVNLRMKDNHRITEYLVRFNSLAVRCSWGEAALRHRFYEGLPSRLKDDVSRGSGKPKDLGGMRLKAQNADARYWERVQERSREGTSNQKTNNSKTPANPSSSSSGNNSNNNQQKTQSNKKNSRPSGSEKTPASSKPELAGKLDSKGKLTAKERQYRIDNNLCLFCGEKGHRVGDCNAAKASSAKGRASTAAAPEPPAPEKKKE
jgi:hypothetical protein